MMTIDKVPGEEQAQCGHCMSREDVRVLKITVGYNMVQHLLLCRTCIAALNRITYTAL